MLNHKAGLVVAVERLGRQALHGAGLAGAAQDHLAGLLQIQAVELGKCHGIGHADHAGAQRHLVGELGRLALAGAIEAADVCREGSQDVADRGDVVLGGTHDSRERAGDRARLAAGDGAVKRHATGDLGGLGNVARKLGRARGEVDQDRTGLGAGQQAVARQVELLDLGGIAHHGKDDIGASRGLGRRIGPDGAALDECGGLGLGAVVDRDGIAGVQDVAGDGGTHDSGADECDGELVCHETFPFGLGVVTRLNTRRQRLGRDLRAPVVVAPAYSPRTRRAMRSESDALSARFLPQNAQATMPGPTCEPMVGPTELRMMVTSAQPSSLRMAASSQSPSFSASAVMMAMGMVRSGT